MGVMGLFLHCLLSDCGEGGGSSDDDGEGNVWELVMSSLAETSKKLKVSGDFLDVLRQAKLLSEKEYMTVMKQTIPEKQSNYVITRLVAKEKGGFDGFCDALRSTGQVDLLKKGKHVPPGKFSFTAYALITMLSTLFKRQCIVVTLGSPVQMGVGCT